MRFRQHRGYVRNKEVEKSTGEHFNKPGHQMADMRITVLEKLKSSDAQLRKTRESFYIQRFNTKYKGMNKNPKVLVATRIFFFFFKFFFSVMKIQNSLTLIHHLVTKSEEGIMLISKYIT